jgi:electron transport complex protein RnfA
MADRARHRSAATRARREPDRLLAAAGAPARALGRSARPGGAEGPVGSVGRCTPARLRGAGRARGSAWRVAVAAGWIVVAAGAASAQNRIERAGIAAPTEVVLRTSAPITRLDPGNFRLSADASPDVPLEIVAARPEPGNAVRLVTRAKLDRTESYRLAVREPPLARPIRPSPLGTLLTVVLSAALINNFVFTRYLGLCIFFGVTKRRDTALGMGATFGMVMVTTAMMSWLLYMFVMKPLQLGFLQILAFIGIVAFMVQLLDTVLKKTHRGLHKRFGIYLVLITTNCIILAVPLLNAAADAGPLESFGLALGSGFGFALALFLMSCARERVELARVPHSFQGLPIAFALAGLFALAFMGFSGLDFYR